MRPALDRWAARRIQRRFPHARRYIDLGCGAGGIGRRLGATLVDARPASGEVVRADLEWYDPGARYDVAVLSNVYEHLPDPVRVLRRIRGYADRLWLSFTPWHSPFGGHEFAPWHYLGVTAGPLHRLGENLFVTSSAGVRRDLALAGWRIEHLGSRYFPWLPTDNEVLAWNIEVCAASCGLPAGSAGAS